MSYTLQQDEELQKNMDVVRQYLSRAGRKGGKASAKTVDTVERARKAGKAGGRGRGKKS